MSAVCLLSHAALTDIESMDNVPYLKSTVLQPGTTADITICIKSERSIGSIKGTFVFPEGITVNSVKGVGDENLNELTNVFLFGGCGGHEEIATVNVTVSPDMKLGEYEMTIDDYQMVEEINYNQDYKGSTTTKLIIQRAAVVKEQGEDYFFKVSPFTAAAGNTNITVQLKNKLDVANFKLIVEYPNGITPTKSGRSYAKPTIIADNLYSTTDSEVEALSVSAPSVSGNVATYKVNNDALDTYMATGEFLPALSLPITVANGAVGVKNVKIAISDIEAYDVDEDPDFENAISIPGGEYMFSIFVGQSTSDVILYGIYDDAAKAAAMEALKGGSADVTQTNLDDSFTPSDVLIYGQSATHYNRSSSNQWGSICLPYAVESGDDVQYYTLSKADTESVTFSPVDALQADQPAFFRLSGSELATSGQGYCMPTTPAEQSPVNDLTLTGTYTTQEITRGNGLYLSNNTLYSGNFILKPFRSYIATPSGNAAKSLRVFVEDDETGLQEITGKLSSEDIYNLQGMRLREMQQGINIVNGRKVIVK